VICFRGWVFINWGFIKMKILATTKMRGAGNVLAPVIKGLLARGHEVDVYATGNENEASASFKDIAHQHIPEIPDYAYAGLVNGHQAVITGLSGSESSDGYFIRVANSLSIPTISVLDRDGEYAMRFGRSNTSNNWDNLPTIITVPTAECLYSITRDLPLEDAKWLCNQAQVVGWAQFDHYAEMAHQFTEEARLGLCQKLGIFPRRDLNLYVHFTQNQDPNSDYWNKVSLPESKKQEIFDYKMKVTKAVFEAASELGIKLVIKPHPGEKYPLNHTLDLVQKHGFVYLPADSCTTPELILAATSVTADKSSCLTDACLLDRNTAGMVPAITEEERCTFPPLEHGAIPYARTFDEIKTTLKLITFPNEQEQEQLSWMRGRFSVDGKAAQKIIDLVERLA